MYHGHGIFLVAPDGTPRLRGSNGSSLTQDRCTVCTKHAIGSETVLGTPDGTPG
jgi:hypothetical protein